MTQTHPAQHSKKTNAHVETSGQGRRTGHAPQNARPALARLLQTREVRQALASILPDVIAVFAGPNPFKQRMMGIVAKYLKRSLARPTDGLEKAELRALFEDPRFFSNLINGGTGGMITQACRIINDLHQQDPEFFTKALAPGFKSWVESVDFGEIREMVDTAATDGQAFIRMANHELWQYPAKMVLLLSLLPSTLNFAADALQVSVGKLNELPPDMVTDVVLSFIRELNTLAIAGAVNELTEVARKIHTGSALLGDPGAPELPKVLSKVMGEIIQKTDPATFWKARIALTEIRAAMDQAMASSVKNQPEWKRLNMIKKAEIANIRLHATNRRLADWDSETDENLAAVFTDHLNAWDVQELAEVGNNLLRIFNRLGDASPALFADITGQFVNAFDPLEVSDAAARILNGPGEAVAPLARAVVPKLVVWMCGVLEPTDDEYEAEAQEALAALRRLLMKEED
ncbi:MAG: hypothetical protein M0Z56_00990 [Desulfobacteraceae bacterium]|nr:hypothetical protein [Desulfobacteraceae bacterium]